MCVCVPSLSVCTKTLAAAVAPPAGGAGIMRGKPTNAAEVAGWQRGGRGHRRQVVGLWPLGQVLPIREQSEASAEGGEDTGNRKELRPPPPPAAS